MTPQIKAYFDELKVYLAKNPTAKVSVLGFTDNQGDSLKNVALSANRAEMVKDFMVSKKFDTAKLVVRGKGPLRPIGNNETEAGRAQNRRVEVRLMYN
jgi:outer membrane protein OmpA-like peptidoglycan-associated protein